MIVFGIIFVTVFLIYRVRTRSVRTSCLTAGTNSQELNKFQFDSVAFPLSPAEVSLCRREPVEGGGRGKIKARGQRWEEEKSRLFLLPIINRALTILYYYYYYYCYYYYYYSLLYTVNDLINARGGGVYLILGVQNSGISTLSIDTSRPSKDPYNSFKSQHRYQSTCSGVTVLPSLVYPYSEIDIKQDEIHKALFMLTKQEP